MVLQPVPDSEARHKLKASGTFSELEGIGLLAQDWVGSQSMTDKAALTAEALLHVPRYGGRRSANDVADMQISQVALEPPKYAVVD